MGLIRVLLIWLLVLAVPAQGAAAATMAACGPHHDGGVSTALAQQTLSAMHAHHGTQGQMAHKHQDTFTGVGQVDQVTASSASPDPSTVAATPASGVQSDQHKCSACASCCSAGAILNKALKLPEPAASSTVFSAVVPTVNAVAVDGPDRPPRMVLA